MTKQEKATAEYNAVVEKAEQRYRKVKEKLQKEYDETLDPIRAKYRAVEQKAMRVYNRVRDPAWRKYEKSVEMPKTLYKQAQKAAEDLRMQKLRKAARVRTQIRKEALSELYASRAD